MKNKRKEYVLVEDIVIPAGTRVSEAPVRTSRFVPFAEASIGFGKDSTGSFTMPMDEMIGLGLARELV